MHTISAVLDSLPAAPIQTKTGISSSTIVSIDSMLVPGGCWESKVPRNRPFLDASKTPVASKTLEQDILYAYSVPHAITQ